MNIVDSAVFLCRKTNKYKYILVYRELKSTQQSTPDTEKLDTGQGTSKLKLHYNQYIRHDPPETLEQLVSQAPNKGKIFSLPDPLETLNRFKRDNKNMIKVNF